MKKASMFVPVAASLTLASLSLLTACDATGQNKNDSQEYLAFRDYVGDMIPEESNGEAPVFDKNVRLTREYSENTLLPDLETGFDSSLSHLPKGQVFIINEDESYMEEVDSSYSLENGSLVLTTTTTEAYGDHLAMNDYVDNLVHKTSLPGGTKTLHSSEYVNRVFSHADLSSYRNDPSSLYYRISTEIQSIYDTFCDIAFNSNRNDYDRYELQTRGNEISFEFERWNGKYMKEEIEGELNTLTLELEFEYSYEEYWNPSTDGKSGVRTLIDYEVDIEMQVSPYDVHYSTIGKDYEEARG